MQGRITLLVLFVSIFLTGVSGQEYVKDTFTDYVGSHKYAISGYFAQTKAEVTAIDLPTTGWYVTSLQMHHDWKYLTNSFSAEAYNQQKYIAKTDSMNFALVSLIGAKDTVITSLRNKIAADEAFRLEKQTILLRESARVRDAFNTCAEGNAAVSLSLKQEREKKKMWMALSVGGVFVGFLFGVLAM